MTADQFESYARSLGSVAIPVDDRRERPDGSIWDYSAEDIYVVYRRVSENLVEFERLIDLRAPDASVE
jgi:hypothetical protein